MPKKGYKQTLEHKSKNSKKGTKNPMFGSHRTGKDNPFYGKKHSEETKHKIGKKNQNKEHRHTEATKKKISIGHKNEKAYNWKGDKVGYSSLHAWIRRNLEPAKSCVKCLGKRGSKKFEWANISHEYRRDLNDYMQLCKICHNEYDDRHKINEKGNK